MYIYSRGLLDFVDYILRRKEKGMVPTPFSSIWNFYQRIEYLF